MRNCCKEVCFKIQCRCEQEKKQKTIQQTQRIDLNKVYSKFAFTLQDELKKQHEDHTKQVDQLNNQIFQLKNALMRLQIRNKKDLDAESQLRSQYNILLQKLKDRQPQKIRSVQIIEKIKEVPIQVDNKQLKEEISFWKNKFNESNVQYLQLKMEKDLLSDDNNNLKIQISRLNGQINHLKQKIEESNKYIDDNSKLIQKLNLQNEFLKNNKEVVVQTKHVFPEFKQFERVRTQTKVQTIYTEKPVEKLVFVDVVKRVKEFIQPERAVVNRIINCQPNSNCRCDQDENQIHFYKSEMNHLNSLVGKLQDNIHSYKNQRQNLVSIINNKNSELNFLQTKMKLFSNGGATRSNIGSTVDVKVTRIRQEGPQSKNISIKNQKVTVRK